jgi:hypothetical protein
MRDHRPRGAGTPAVEYTRLPVQVVQHLSPSSSESPTPPDETQARGELSSTDFVRTGNPLDAPTSPLHRSGPVIRTCTICGGSSLRVPPNSSPARSVRFAEEGRVGRVRRSCQSPGDDVQYTYRSQQGPRAFHSTRPTTGRPVASQTLDLDRVLDQALAKDKRALVWWTIIMQRRSYGKE